MSQYYTRPRQRPLTDAPSVLTYHRDEDLSPSACLDDSVYIFPNPSSSPPSPSLSSEFSIPTDFTPSATSYSRSRDSSPQRRLGSTSRLELEVWDWTADTDGGSNLSPIELDDDVERADRWELVAPRRPPQRSSPSYYIPHHHQIPSDASRLYHLRRKRRRRSRTTSSTRAPIPHARIHIPLLSLIISLLSIDESTVHLLTHSAPQSVLFPGHDQICPNDTEEADKQPHGMTKLLLPSGESHSLKEGCAVACDPTVVTKNPFIFSPLRLAGLWGLFGDVMVNGRNALREIFG